MIMDKQERLEELMNEIDFGHPENLAVEGLIRGIHEEMERIGIDRGHELYNDLFDELNSSYTIRK